VSRPIPQVLIADDADATRTFAVIRQEPADAGTDQPALRIYEVHDTGEAELLETWTVQPITDDLLLADAERIAAALEEIEFRDERRGFSAEGSEDNDYEL